MYDITAIPPEIWQDIFTLCISLALSCKFFHFQSSRVRFHSVVLSSIVSLERFLAFARTRPDDQKPLIRHLSLTLLPSSASQVHTVLFHRDYNPRDGALVGEALHTRFTSAANELFVTVAPTLRTLCLTTEYSHTFAPFPCDMPMLEELTMMGSISAMAGPNRPRLPALKRFHLIPQSADADIQELATALTASALCAAPLTHQRLSQIYDLQRPNLSLVLARTLGVPEHLAPGGTEDNSTPAPGHQVPVTLAHVHEVIVQTIIPDLGWCGNAYFGYWRETLAFEGFVQACNDVQGLHVLAVPRKQQNFRWRERLYGDWVDRIEGGRGCWIRDAEEEEALEKLVERDGDDDPSIEDGWDADELEEAIGRMEQQGICGGVVDETLGESSPSQGTGHGRNCTIM
ncbi:hypothetical protein L226DRAFT_518345 [Lentinus tigrinus ALCF2SS1-7]|uniref:uncharacterized protein n=1 Tax=Lentinus tigrinus ALCF2SS1-7 TaxID=1328758 RepID=UPI001165E129|nr:hypothetical protein L226DRAFT_518345 [Lentinus tigrinus ALCF2SS1-7]